MTDPDTASCVCCHHRQPIHPPACQSCRHRIPARLWELRDLCEQLASLGYVERDGRSLGPKVFYPEGHKLEGQEVPHFDQVANVLPAGPIAGRINEPRVSGTKDRGVPARLDILGSLDLRSVHDEYGDQTGHVSVCSVLGSWAREWAGLRRESEPEPTVSALCRWLADRTDWAFSHHPAVGEFAAEVDDLHLMLLRANGLTEQRPELCVGVPCRSVDCDMKTLYRIPRSTYIECSSCGLLLTEGEYADWLGICSAAANRGTVVRQP